MRTKVTTDGYIWIVIDKNTALHLFSDYDIELFKLYDDNSECAIETFKEIYDHVGEFGIEVGFIKDLLPLCPHCGKSLVPSNNPDYVWECLECDENFTEYEI